MEFEENAPVTDEQRALAESRRMSIEPLDASVKPEERSDEYTAAEHLRGSAIANAPNDIEQDTAAIQPSLGLISPTGSKKAPSLRSVQAGMVAAVTFVIVAVAAIVFYALS